MYDDYQPAPEIQEESKLKRLIRRMGLGAFSISVLAHLIFIILAIFYFVKWVELGAPHGAAGETPVAGNPDAPAARAHWAFQPVVRSPLPGVSNTIWPRTPIDTFILAKLEMRQWQPSPLASRNELIRRLSFDLTGLPTANSSLLDEGTAAAEALTLIHRATRGKDDLPVVLDDGLLPQTIAVVQTRAEAIGIDTIVIDTRNGLTVDAAGVIVAYPRADGEVVSPKAAIDAAHAQGGVAVVVADPLALVLLESPGSMGADVVVGSSQRFGVPMFYGGPHAGFMAVRDGLERNLPGRLVGVSVDAMGRPAYRLAL